MTVYTIFTYVGIAALLWTLFRFFFDENKRVMTSFLQNFVGILFVFSGFVKAVDPMGTSYKMHEYFEAMHLEFMNPLSTFLAVVMITAEIALGVALLIGWRSKITTALLLLLNVFFLLLTGFTYLSGYEPTITFFVLSLLVFAVLCYGVIAEKSTVILAAIGAIVAVAILSKFSSLLLTTAFVESKMKVTDCGCFGDFIKLKPWETFWKDVLLTAMILIVALRYKSIKPLFNLLSRDVITFVTSVAFLFFCLYNFVWNEPVIDFRPYKIGNDLNELRVVKQAPKIDMLFVYQNKNTGEIKSLKADELSKLNYEVDTFVKREDKVIDPGIPARIMGLNIYNEDHEDITESLLHDPNYTLAVVAYKLGNTHECCFTKHLNPLALACDKAGIKFYALSSDDAEAFRHKNQTAYPFYMADETPLKTIMRSNPGLVLLKNGVVVNKWHHKHFPTFEELNKTYFKK